MIRQSWMVILCNQWKATATAEILPVHQKDYKSKLNRPTLTLTTKPIDSYLLFLQPHLDQTMSLDDLPQSSKRFIQEMLAIISAEQDLEKALRLAQWLALYLWENHLGLYRLDTIEKLITEKCRSIALPIAPTTEPQTELHIASSVYKNGGHTALMRCLMLNANRPVHALITRSEDPQGDALILAIPPECVSSPQRSASAKDKIEYLVSVMARFGRIILHIHPDDVMCAAALHLLKQVNPSVQVVLVNHADHVFSVGWPSADRVLEISAYGWSLRQKRHVEKIASFIGIPISCPTPLERKYTASPPFAMSGGASFKFKPSNGMSLPRILTQLLHDAPELHLRIVGASGKDWWWWRLRLQYRGRIHLVKSVPKVDYKQMLDECALYIDSYPWLGGTAFPEALMLGVPVAGLTGLAWGYSSADQIRSPSSQAFIQACLQLLHKDPKSMREQAQARLRCIQFHAEHTVRNRMNTCLDENVFVEPDKDLLDKRTPVDQRHKVTGRSVLPSRRRGGLVYSDTKIIARVHKDAFGWLNWSSITLLYYASKQSSTT